MSSSNNTTRDTPLSDMAIHELIWAKLAELGIGQVVVDFNGEGDSGEITDVRATTYPDNAYAYDDPKIQALNDAFRSATLDFEPDDTCRFEDTKLMKVIEVLTNEIITGKGFPDWWNDDGGFGEVHWIGALPDDPNTGTKSPAYIRVELNIREVHHEYSEFEYDRFGTETTEDE